MARARSSIQDDPQESLFRRRLDDARALGEASRKLAQAAPHLSARGGLSAEQEAGLWGALGAVGMFLAIAPEALAVAAALIVSGVFSLIVLVRVAAAIGARLPGARAAAPRIADHNLPVLTILAPLYREANMAASLVEALSSLDYPASRLDVKLIVEGDDRETLAAIGAIALPRCFEVLPVPPSEPRTKPKALNYGLAFARGDVVTVFDAEDLPAPGQPREAVAALMADPRLAVVQAPLLAHNGRDGWLAGQFQLEYAVNFRVWLPFLARLRAPMLLGGTSNYFRRSVLVSAGGWDAWNVTEDADLGVRLARMGSRAATITQPTLEEAPVRFRDWRAQRTRWIKGYFQTWLVHMRSPLRLMRELGVGPFLWLQATLGGALLAALLHGPIAVWVLLAALTPALEMAAWHVAVLGTGYGSVVAAAVASGEKLRLSSILTLPLYWPLLSFISACAIWELCRRPHYWAKTPHGRSKAPGPRLAGDGAADRQAHEDNVVQLPLPF